MPSRHFQQGGNNAEYWSWLRDHPGSIVVELAKGDGKIHGAECSSIRKPNGNLNKHGKYCSTTLSDAEAWAHANHETTRRCKHCTKRGVFR